MAWTRVWRWDTLPILALGLALQALPAAAQDKAPAGANNSCIFANDGECDETNGTCAAGTDSADCRPTAAVDPANSCRFAFDQRCDEPGKGSGLCTAGTDTADCAAAATEAPQSTPPAVPATPAVPAPPAPGAGAGAGAGVAAGADSCPFAKDGDCDEPGIGSGACAAGTDTTDCKAKEGGAGQSVPPQGGGVAPPPNAADSCPFANDGECDEPGIGSGACSAGTDTADCKAKRGDAPGAVTPPAAGGADSCPFANDGECDEPGIGSGACAAGTDTTDCKAQPGGGQSRPSGSAGTGDDSCQFAKDGECDDPDGGTGLCAPSTDATDCRQQTAPSTQPPAGGGTQPGQGAPPPPPPPPVVPGKDDTANSCEFARDGECDEPGKGSGLCAAGTDTADCSAPAQGGSSTPGSSGTTPNQSSGGGAAAPAACPFTNDGDCDEPGKGTGLCAAGTDEADCRGK